MPRKTTAPTEPVMDEQQVETTATEPSVEQPSRLVGQELIAFYNERKALGKTHAQIAYDAGYYSVTKNNRERTLVAQFNEAFLEAQGVETGGRAAVGRSSDGLSSARVSGQGILLVSQLATRHVGAVQGSVFTVEYPQGDLKGVGAQILVTLTDTHKPVVPRKPRTEELPGTPLLEELPAAEA